MYIPYGFDEANAARKRRLNSEALEKSVQLNNRIKHFLKNINNNCSLTQGQKNKIKETLLKDL